MKPFSLERGNLYEANTITEAANTYKEKRDNVLNKIIGEGKATDSFEDREIYRKRLKGQIREGLIDREYLSRHHWPENRILITDEIVDFLLPQVKQVNEPEKKEKPRPVIKHINEPVLPTKNGKGPEVGNGEGIDEKKLIPRFEMLTEFLDKNGINTDEYLCYEGENTPEMMRGQSYIMMVIPGLDKMVLVCDEEGNATYIVHTAPTEEEFELLMRDEEMEDNERNPEFYYRMSKQELQILEKEKGLDLVSRVKWDENDWQRLIYEKLTSTVEIDKSQKEIVEILSRDKKQPAPKGWLTFAGLLQEVGRKRKVKQIVDQHREEHPEWFKEYLDGINRLREHYSPELVEIIKEELSKQEKAPDGWMTNSHLSRQGEEDFFYIVQKIADQHREEHPEWFKIFINKTGGPFEYFAPALVEIIKEELSKQEKAPDGWMTNNYLAAELNKTRRPVKKRADQHREEHPEWFKEYIDSVGKKAEHYSPELVEIIKEELSKQEKAPDGWITNHSLEIDLDRVHSVIKRRADKYRGEHPEWFKDYLTPGGPLREHYSPELVRIIKEELGK